MGTRCAHAAATHIRGGMGVRSRSLPGQQLGGGGGGGGGGGSGRSSGGGCGHALVEEIQGALGAVVGAREEFAQVVVADAMDDGAEGLQLLGDTRHCDNLCALRGQVQVQEGKA